MTSIIFLTEIKKMDSYLSRIFLINLTKTPLVLRQWGFLFCVESSTLCGVGKREGFFFLAEGTPVYVAGKEHHEGEDDEDEHCSN